METECLEGAGPGTPPWSPSPSLILEVVLAALPFKEGSEVGDICRNELAFRARDLYLPPPLSFSEEEMGVNTASIKEKGAL